MNPIRRRDQAALEATAEHRRREDAAPRLRDEVRRLLTLRLRFDDIRGESQVAAASYVRPVVVETAPALFEIRCMEPRCNGRHDLTAAVLSGLRRSESSFEGTSQCDGMVGDTPCDRTLAYACEASYRS
jgi:hypothetical protein